MLDKFKVLIISLIISELRAELAYCAAKMGWAVAGQREAEIDQEKCTEEAKEMTKRQRLEAAMHGGTPDRVPVSIY